MQVFSCKAPPLTPPLVGSLGRAAIFLYLLLLPLLPSVTSDLFDLCRFLTLTRALKITEFYPVYPNITGIPKLWFCRSFFGPRACSKITHSLAAMGVRRYGLRLLWPVGEGVPGNVRVFMASYFVQQAEC